MSASAVAVGATGTGTGIGTVAVASASPEKSIFFRVGGRRFGTPLFTAAVGRLRTAPCSSEPAAAGGATAGGAAAAAAAPGIILVGSMASLAWRLLTLLGLPLGGGAAPGTILVGSMASLACRLLTLCIFAAGGGEEDAAAVEAGELGAGAPAGAATLPWAWSGTTLKPHGNRLVAIVTKNRVSAVRCPHAIRLSYRQ